MSRALSIGEALFYPIVKQTVQDWSSAAHWTALATLHPTAAQPSGPDRTGGHITTLTPASSDLREADLLRAAFRDLHGARLHGFALLLTVGDRSRAATAAATVLASGTTRAAQLRHPERAAAWLRARLVRVLRQTSDSRRQTRAERGSVLLELGVPEAMMAALEGLPLDDRAAVVSASVERFSIIDVATILGRDLLATRRILQAARRRYLAATTLWTADLPAEALPGGEIAARIEQVAARAIGPRIGAQGE